LLKELVHVDGRLSDDVAAGVFLLIEGWRGSEEEERREEKEGQTNLSRVQRQVDLTEVQLPNDDLSNLIPRVVRRATRFSRVSRPVAVVEKDLRFSLHQHFLRDEGERKESAPQVEHPSSPTVQR
jgi:hypothetical protein